MFIKDFTALLAICTSTLSATAYSANNSLYLELGGNAAAYSVNYERNFDGMWGIRVGLGGIWADGDALIGAPLLINKYWGDANSNHKFETGVGATYFAFHENSNYFDNDELTQHVAGTASIGYRYLPRTPGMTFKVAFTPIITSTTFIPWLGFSVGRTF